MPCLYRIVYISRATMPLDHDAAAQLAERARSCNARSSVTGLMLHDGMRFIQALEGSEQAVTETMARIARDPRHEAIAYVSEGPVACRQFGDWAMALNHVHDRASAETFVEDVKLAVAQVDDINLSAAFIGFAVLGRAELLRARAA